MPHNHHNSSLQYISDSHRFSVAFRLGTSVANQELSHRQREALRGAIVAAEFKRDLDAEIARGDALADGGDLSGAVDVYTQVRRRVDANAHARVSVLEAFPVEPRVQFTSPATSVLGAALDSLLTRLRREIRAHAASNLIERLVRYSDS